MMNPKFRLANIKRVTLITLLSVLWQFSTAQQYTYTFPNNGSGTANNGSVYCLNTDNWSNYPGHHYYGSLVARSGSVIKICGNVKLYGSVNFNSGSTIIISNGGSFSVTGAYVNYGNVIYSNDACATCPDISLNANPNPICPNGNVDLSSLYTALTDAGSWSITNAPSGSNASINGTVFNAGLTAGNYTVTFTANPTGATGCDLTEARTITVAPSPVVDLGPDAAICDMQSYVFTALSEPNTSYLWSNGEIGNSIIASEEGSYALTATNATGCVASDEVYLTVNDLPTIDAGIDQTICFGSEITLNATGASTISWSPAITNNTPFTPSSTQTYTATGTDENGCSANDEILVVVNPLPVVTLAALADVCIDGGSVTLDGGSPVGGTYSGNGVSGNSFDPATAGVGTHTITYSYTNEFGCFNSTSTTINVSGLPVVNLTLAAICGGSVTFDAGNAGSSYLWSTGETSQTINVSSEGTYSVVVTNAAGCVGTGSAYAYNTISSVSDISYLDQGYRKVIVTNVYSGNKRIAPGSYEGSLAIYGGTVILDNAHFLGGFEVHPGATLIVCGTSSNTSDGYGGIIKIHSGATAKIFGSWTTNGSEYLNGSIIMMEGATLEINGSVSSQSGLNISYAGSSDCNAFVDNAISYSNSNFISSGAPSCATLDCPSSSCGSSKMENEVAFENESIDKSMNIFPNPTTGLATLNYASNENGRHVVSVFNTIGQVVMVQSFEKTEESINMQISLSDLANGTYSVVMTSNNNSAKKSVVVVH